MGRLSHLPPPPQPRPVRRAQAVLNLAAEPGNCIVNDPALAPDVQVHVARDVSGQVKRPLAVAELVYQFPDFFHS